MGILNYLKEQLWSSDPKWDENSYPGPFTTRSDNDDQIAHHVNCYIDEKEVDCFTDQLAADGYVYNDVRDWYERTWSTNEGKETIQEVYKHESGEWKQLMIGYGDRGFYEEKVNAK